MSKDESGLHLKRTHAYFYQVQGQLAICEREYCDFVCWTSKGIVIERMYRDRCFFADVLKVLKTFFVQVILPRVLAGKYVTSTDKETSHSQEKSTFCFCEKGEFGDMIACDNPSCIIEWFHFKCVGLTTAPSGTWFCPDCKLGM